MASKSRKTPSSSTPTPMQPPPNVRPASPLGPIRQSRLAEKADLQNLNDRLAVVLDKVRHLESENARLTVETQTFQETVTRETTNIKQMYEHELADARNLLDETSREKARLEIDTKRMWEENTELKQRLDKKTKEHAQAENNARMSESRCNELANKINTACSDRKKAMDEAKELQKERDKLQKQLNELRKNLEEETLARVDLENIVQSLREELTFKDQIHSQELVETRKRRQVDITEIDGRLSEQYEAKLQQSLQELRDQYEGQMRSNREEIETLYESKLRNLQNASARNAKAASSAIEESRLLKSRIDSRVAELENLTASLQVRIRDLEHQLDTERNQRLADEAELQRLREEIALQLQEYQDLMDIKVSLDLEIAAYDKLLSGEEMRLNITPTNAATAAHLSQSYSRATPTSRATPLRGAKRKRTIVQESEERNASDYSITAAAIGDIEISEVEHSGKYEIGIGGWQLFRQAGTNETAFRFHRSVKLEPGAFVTVWSSNAGAQHDPPANIVMKEQIWFAGDKMNTILMNSNDDEVASLEHTRLKTSTQASRHRESVGSEDLYHQQGDPQKTGEACGVM